VYNAALLADAEKSANKTIRAQIIASKISKTALCSGKLPEPIKPRVLNLTQNLTLTSKCIFTMFGTFYTFYTFLSFHIRFLK
jgi:hypothetical protein